VNVSDEALMAYADGEADAATRALVEAAMGEDPNIAQRIAKHRALRDAMRAVHSAVMEEPVPERLLAAARGRFKQPADKGSSLARAKGAAGLGARVSTQRWRPAAMAASLLLGVAVGFFTWHGSAALIETGAGGRLVAGAALAESLSRQLAQDPSPVAVTGLSFRNKAGNYCRTFSLAGTDAAAGLACREGSGWNIKLLAQSAHTESRPPNFRTAASGETPAVRAAVEQLIDGEPLDRAGEIAARQAGWAAAH
jgi:anti-sigma factor RsiW